jgi:hypothetical protein
MAVAVVLEPSHPRQVLLPHHVEVLEEEGTDAVDMQRLILFYHLLRSVSLRLPVLMVLVVVGAEEIRVLFHQVPLVRRLLPVVQELLLFMLIRVPYKENITYNTNERTL